MSPVPQPPTVVVAGDLLTDVNLLRHTRTPDAYDVPVPPTVVDRQFGGAWYLEELIKLGCHDIEVDIRAPERRQPPTEAYSVWSLFDLEQDKAKAPKVWRVSEFLGCNTNANGAQLICVPKDVSDPDVLALDDLTLGFRDREDAWPAALRAGGKPRAIVLKSSPPLGTGKVWDKLISDFADRLTLVVDVGSLRDRRAAISRAISWDLAVEETAKEFHDGASARDLGQCWRVIVHFGSAGAAVFSRRPPRVERKGGGRSTSQPSKRVRFERFLYHPRDLEGSWEARRAGMTFGTTSVLVAALTRHYVNPDTYPLFVALGRGLAAARLRHERGAGEWKADSRDPQSTFSATGAFPALQEILHPPKPTPPVKGGTHEPAGSYCTAFPHHVLDDPITNKQPAYESDLLRDVTGAGLDYAAAKAMEVVLHGPDRALRTAPSARYGKYFTVDRQEIERINAIRSLMLTYSDNVEDRRPLSIAVFGPPGSGKSFAIKQLASAVFGSKTLFHEFNLSQLSYPGGLHLAFHIVRDSALSGRVPVVFWDEFDTDGLIWLKAFLAPMQDGEFHSESVKHPLGKAIFVFAGGTAPSFELFDRTSAGGDTEETFRAVKGPDFVSRLRGYVNIKGPNPVPPTMEPGSPHEWETTARHDPAHLIRRAILLRAVLERFAPHLIDPRTKAAAISLSVVRGFLRAQDFVHGARSLESIVNMSDLGSARQFSAGHLPSRDLLRLHVTLDFLDRIREGELEVEVIEALAQAYHERWKKAKEAAGWKPGEERDDATTRHPLLKPYDELDEGGKEGNRAPARLTTAKLRSLGYGFRRLAPQETDRLSARSLSDEELDRLMLAEHDRWLREKLLDGYDWASSTNERLRLHRDIAPFECLPPEDQNLDREQVAAIPKTLRDCGFVLERDPAAASD